jgi:hypothetical protein
MLVDGVPVGRLGPGRHGDRLPPARAVGKHPQPIWFQHVAVVHEGSLGAPTPRALLSFSNEPADDLVNILAGLFDLFHVEATPSYVIIRDAENGDSSQRER